MARASISCDSIFLGYLLQMWAIKSVAGSELVIDVRRNGYIDMKKVLVVVALIILHFSGFSATLFHCKNPNGGTFWSSAHCSTHNALIDRTVTVPDNTPFEQQVQIGNKVRADAEALYAPQQQAPQTVVRQQVIQQAAVNCAEISQEIATLDALARQPQSAGVQDSIAQRSKNLRDIQFRSRCR